MAGGIGLQQGINKIIGQSTQAEAIGQTVKTQQKQYGLQKEFYKNYIKQTAKDLEAADKYIKDNNVTGESIQKGADKLKEIYKDKPKLRDSGIDQDMMKQFLALKPEQPTNQRHPIEQRQQEIERRKTGKQFITDTINLYHKTRGV